MKLTKLTLCLATLALGVASAASSFSITLPSDTMVGDTHLKAGQYKLELQGNQAIFKQGKTTVQVPVTIEKASNKFRFTALETVDSKLNAIDLRGTDTKVVLSPSKDNGGSVPAGQ